MGCCPSANVKKQRRSNLSLTHDSIYTGQQQQQQQQQQEEEVEHAISAAPRRSASKRSYTSRISSSSSSSRASTTSSGVSSTCTTPSRPRSILSRCGSNLSDQLPKPKPNKCNYRQTSMTSSLSTPTKSNATGTGTGYDMHSICDDFCEATEQQQQQQQLDKSFGYYTESSRASTPSKSCLRRTQDHSQSYNCSKNSTTTSMAMETETEGERETERTPVISDLEMEMYMMSQSQCLMPKTSSPISQRRDFTFDLLDDHCQYAPPITALQTTSKSYHKWRNYLQTTPAYMLHNVTHIPEAVAGQFCPADFPAFSDLAEMDSAAKRYKVDAPTVPTTTATTTPAYALQNGMAALGLTHTISTDL